jgi:hypothetical protein
MLFLFMGVVVYCACWNLLRRNIPVTDGKALSLTPNRVVGRILRLLKIFEREEE